MIPSKWFLFKVLAMAFMSNWRGHSNEVQTLAFKAL